MIDYIDEDVAYLLGMIYARGRLSEQERIKILEIDIEYKSLEAEGTHTVFNQKNQIILSVNRIRDRINELLEVDIRLDERESSLVLFGHFTKNSMSWRNLRLLTDGKRSFYEFTLPQYFFKNDVSIKKEFLKGFCDLAGYIRKSNVDQAGNHRVYLQIANKNWILPIQICHLLQVDFKIPVQGIQWGHPNIREPHKTKVTAKYSGWAREHQIRIYADEFRMGFGFEYKQKILEELAEDNRSKGKRATALCAVNKKSRGQKKPKHPGEKSQTLPPVIRGKHITGFRQICKAMGCCQMDAQKEIL
jgi:hypothetical protein